MILNKLKKAILEAGLTQSEIARRHNAKVSRLNMFLCGFTSSTAMARIVAEELNMSIIEVMALHKRRVKK